jgi:hypothetical protein
MITSTTWQVPEGHQHVAAFSTQHEAVEHARVEVAQHGDEWVYYLSDKRGSWEIFRMPR